ncbi:MAG: succinylglutamate desuccinylase/aspartoacylase family protein, partial [Oleiphilaceae bacterium]|nr:succinylglutamate desuccinylase/aspartoacylase family protein [Oleiphilaceae bacterium]
MTHPAQTLFGPSASMLQACLRNLQQDFPRETNIPQGHCRIHAAGILEIIPSQPKAPALVLSSGIHGNETAPIELLDHLISDILHHQLQPQRPLLLIMGHPQAMRENSRFVLFNMNRLFMGTHQQAPYAGSVDAQRAAVLEAALADFHSRFPIAEHYDLHTA